MSNFKKFLLMSESEVQRLKQKEIKDYNPELRTLAFQQSEIDNILNDGTLSPEEKMKMFQVAHQRFQSLYEKFSGTQQRPPPADIEKHAPTEQAPPAHETAPEEEEKDRAEPEDHSAAIIDTLPIAYRKRAKNILNLMQKHPDITSFDDSHRLVSHGALIPGTNIVDLLKDIFISKKSFEPQGRFEFLNSLRALNVPASFISNKNLARVYAQPIGAAFAEPPPGKKSRVRYVY